MIIWANGHNGIENVAFTAPRGRVKLKFEIQQEKS